MKSIHSLNAVLPSVVVPLPSIEDKDERRLLHEQEVNEVLADYGIEVVILSGYMRILSKRFIRLFGKSIINIHPSLLPKFKGLNTYERVLRNKERKTGCTVHFVNEKLDSGKIILKKFFYVNEEDSVASLKRKTQILEYNAFSEAIIRVIK